MDSISPYGDDKFNLISVWLGPQHAGGTKETFLGYMHVEEPLRREDGFSAPAVPVALGAGSWHTASRSISHRWAHAAVAYSHNATS